MPPRPHRTVDRVVQILETAALSPNGVSLTELATTLDAAKSSVQGLVNGLVARGYLNEEDHRLHLGPGPFILASRANKSAALSLDHEILVRLSEKLGCIILSGIRLGDALVHVDHVGHSPILEYISRTHTRRPLYTSAAGKILLTNLSESERNRFIGLAGSEQVDAVHQFLTELPHIREHDLAFNRAETLADVQAVATSLRSADGGFIAAITAVIDPSEGDRLDEVGENLKDALADVLRRHR